MNLSTKRPLAVSIAVSALLVASAVAWLASGELFTTALRPTDHDIVTPASAVVSLPTAEIPATRTRSEASSAGEPLPLPALRLFFLEEETERPLAGVTATTDSGHSASSDREGVARLPADAQLVGCVRPGYWAHTLLLEPGTAERTVLLVPCPQLVGLVTGEAGEPLADAAVHVVERGGPPGEAQRLLSERTGPEGEFALTLPGHLVPAQHMELVVEASGFLPRRRNIALVIQEDTRLNATNVEVEVVLHASSAIEGRVLGANGRPASGIEVAVAPENGTLLTTRTRRDGSYHFEAVPPGEFELSAAAPGHTPARAFDSVDAGETLTLDLRLGGGRELRGQVVDTTGRPVSGARLEARFASESEEAPGDLLALLGTRRAEDRPFRSGSTDDAGRFLLPDVPTESFLVRVEAEGYSRQEVEQQGNSATELVVVLEPLATVTANVTAAETGEPLEHAAVRILPLDAAELTLPATVLVTGPGAFTSDGPAPGSYALHVTSPGYREYRETIVVEGGEQLALDVELEDGKAGTGTLVDDATGLPVAGALVTARGDSASPHLATSITAVSSDDGTFELSGLDAIAYTVTAVRAGYLPASRRIDLSSPAEESVELRLSPAPSQPAFPHEQSVKHDREPLSTSALDAERRNL